MFFFEYSCKKLLIKIIRLYQKTISFDHGFFKYLFPYGFCRFNPTCSEYAIQSIDKHGVFRGSVLAFWRILRCNPWNKGGNDSVK